MAYSAVILALLAILLPSTLAVVDLTLEAGATGTDVVLATISRLESADIFPSDRRLLRRIAYVETDDGQSSHSHGGIWSVDQALFQATKANESLAGKRADIAAAFPEVGDWEKVRWEDLAKPLWSALAARLVLCLVTSDSATEIPSASDVQGQALFWKEFYNSEGDVAEFERRVYLVIEEES